MQTMDLKGDESLQFDHQVYSHHAIFLSIGSTLCPERSLISQLAPGNSEIRVHSISRQPDATMLIVEILISVQGIRQVLIAERLVLAGCESV